MQKNGLDKGYHDNSSQGIRQEAFNKLDAAHIPTDNNYVFYKFFNILKGQFFEMFFAISTFLE
jgi:hypothetical protein